MKASIWLWLLLPAVASGQSLGDVARQEKERQKKNQDSGVKARTFTEDDVKGNKGQLANDPGSKGSGAVPPAPAAPAASSATSYDDRSHDEAKWRQRVAQATAKVQEAQKTYDKLSGLTLVPDSAYVDASGKVVIGSVEQLQSMTAQAKTELEAAQKALDDLLETARRQNVPPGWLR